MFWKAFELTHEAKLELSRAGWEQQTQADFYKEGIYYS